MIACSHGADSLDSALRALGELEFREGLEVIVIDDGAREGRREAVIDATERGLPVHYLRLPNVNKGASWNVALRESSGEYLAFIDDDCIPPPGWLAAFQDAFDAWVVGIAGGPDRAHANASVLGRCLGYVLTSFAGTLGVRGGSSPLSRYYPRPWNMAARKEALVLAGGFDERSSEAPEVPMIQRLERIGYRAFHQPKAFVRHRLETGLARFLARNFRLGMERARGLSQPGLSRVYGVTLIMLLALLALAVYPGTHALGLRLLRYSAGIYALTMVLSGLHAAILMRTPAAVVLVPFLMITHHAAHIFGYLFGLCLGKRHLR